MRLALAAIWCFAGAQDVFLPASQLRGSANDSNVAAPNAGPAEAAAKLPNALVRADSEAIAQGNPHKQNALKDGRYTLQQRAWDHPKGKFVDRFLDAHQTCCDSSAVMREDEGNSTQWNIRANGGAGSDLYLVQQEVSGRYLDAHQSCCDHSAVTRDGNGRQSVFSSTTWQIRKIEGQDLYKVQQWLNGRYLDAHQGCCDYSAVTRAHHGESTKWTIKAATFSGNLVDDRVQKFVLKPAWQKCDRGRYIRSWQECEKAYKFVKDVVKYGLPNPFEHPMMRKVQRGSWPEVPWGCSVQYQGAYVTAAMDQTPHYNHYSRNRDQRSRFSSGEFRMLCRGPGFRP